VDAALQEVLGRGAVPLVCALVRLDLMGQNVISAFLDTMGPLVLVSRARNPNLGHLVLSLISFIYWQLATVVLAAMELRVLRVDSAVA